MGRTVLDDLLAWCAPDSGSPDPEQRTARKMVALLLDDLPSNGPRADNKNFSKLLRDQIFEFRTGPKRGKKLRVLWFYGIPPRRRTIICVTAFFKRETTDADALNRAITLQHRYVRAQKADSIQVTDLE